MEPLRDKTTADLVKLLKEKREALRMFRFGVAGSKVRNVREGRSTRKDIARLSTELAARTKRA